MTQLLSNLPILTRASDEAIETLLRSLRQKARKLVEWKACQQLQKPVILLRLFLATGFEPIQQNQVIVGAMFTLPRRLGHRIQCDRTIRPADIFVRVAPAHPVRTGCRRR